MVEKITGKLIALMNSTGYPIKQNNGQRIFGPPPNWNKNPPKGTEIFVGKIPTNCFEDELVPIFSKIGQIYELRLMMDFSGTNKGYAFVCYTKICDAYKAVRKLNGYEIRPNRYLGVVKSVDNSRLFIGGIPKNKTKEELFVELQKYIDGVVNLILYKHSDEKFLNRGFAFIEFSNHKMAAMARRKFLPEKLKLWNHEVMVDWAEPEPDIDEEIMQQVKILYFRNISTKTSQSALQCIIETRTRHKVDRVKKIKDFAFVHFAKREYAEKTLEEFDKSTIDDCVIEVKWAKPVNKEVYKIQKMSKGNAKFNNSQSLIPGYFNNDLSDDIRSVDLSISADDGVEVEEIPDSSDFVEIGNGNGPLNNDIEKLSSLCRRYGWSPPVYTVSHYRHRSGASDVFVSCVRVVVGFPLLRGGGGGGPVQGECAAGTSYGASSLAAHQALIVLKEMCNKCINKTAPPGVYNPTNAYMIAPKFRGVALPIASYQHNNVLYPQNTLLYSISAIQDSRIYSTFRNCMPAINLNRDIYGVNRALPAPIMY